MRGGGDHHDDGTATATVPCAHRIARLLAFGDRDQRQEVTPVNAGIRTGCSPRSTTARRR
jgi:hypothetical protein